MMPPRLRVGDRVRFVSPASTPDRERMLLAAAMLENWGLKVDFGENAFRKFAYLAGTDEERLADFNAALRDPDIRAIIATRGGKGSYRIADRLDFEAAKNDPKFVIGFSDISILHFSLWKHCQLIGIHGALYGGDDGRIAEETSSSLQRLLMRSENVVISSREEEATSALTTTGTASGPLIGGNLDMIATAAGWALPDLNGAILLMEAVEMYLGQVDRHLTMLRKGGHLAGVVGIAVGQFTNFKPSSGITIIDLLRDHLGDLNVPILGGLPLGHGYSPLSVPIGSMAFLDTAARKLIIEQ